jgi:hypothetical protein
MQRNFDPTRKQDEAKDRCANPRPDSQSMTASSSTSLWTGLRSRFLQGLAPADLKVILAAATQRRLSENSVVTNHGDTANHFFLLTKGRARFFYITEGGRRILLHWLAPGEIFGVMSLVPNPAPYLVSTEMVRDGMVFVWERTTIQDLVARYPRLAVNALSTASRVLGCKIACSRYHVVIVSTELALSGAVLFGHSSAAAQNSGAFQPYFRFSSKKSSSM